jgi:hypothetical protein
MKLNDYQKRMSRTSPQIEPDPSYKWYVLNELLTKGSIDTMATEQAFAQYHDWHQPNSYWNAVAVITAYNTGETEGMTMVAMRT